MKERVYKTLEQINISKYQEDRQEKNSFDKRYPYGCMHIENTFNSYVNNIANTVPHALYFNTGIKGLVNSLIRARLLFMTL